jgi:hypothetical protein
LVGIGFGGYYGLILQSAKFDGMRHYLQPEEKIVFKIIGRIIQPVLICTPIMALYLLGTSQISNVYLLMLVKSLIPTTFVGVHLFGFSDELSLRLHFYDKLLDL